MKKIRLFIYDGEEKWVKKSFASYPLNVNTAFGSITSIDNLSEITDIINRMNQQVEADDSIDPTEAI